MLDEATRTAILKLAEAGHGIRAIARAVGRSRSAVQNVIDSGMARPGEVRREEKAEHHRERIIELYSSCRRNLVRVHEELRKDGADYSYQALTAFCRRHGIGREARKPVGEYSFAPGEEMQHDTSPHDVILGGKKMRVQTASLVMAFSRMLFFQMYTCFRRFHCKLFLTVALKYMGGVCGRCVIDNTHVVVLRGTGREMVPVPEMEAFAARFGFVFIAHEKGDADRKGRVERPFHYIENNFLAGRAFKDLDDLNEQAVAWCDEKNAIFKRHLRAKPTELFTAEKAHLKPLPIWIPEPYQLHHRMVSMEGFVKVDGHRYSAPYELIGRRVEVRETQDRMEIYDGPRLVGSHPVCREQGSRSVVDPSHRPDRPRPRRRKLLPEEEELLSEIPQFGDYIADLKKRSTGRGTLSLRKLLRMVREYPRDAVTGSLESAAKYGLFDMERLEGMILKNVRNHYFRIPGDDG